MRCRRSGDRAQGECVPLETAWHEGEHMTQPDFRPYQSLPVDPRIFDAEKAKDPKDPDYGKARKLPTFPLEDPDEIEKVLRRGEGETKVR